MKGAKVTGEIVEKGKEKKVIIFKYRAKKRYHKKQGHRQPFNKIKNYRYQNLIILVLATLALKFLDQYILIHCPGAALGECELS